MMQTMSMPAWAHPAPPVEERGWFYPVTEAAVPADVKETAAAMLAQAKHELGLAPATTIRWFKPETERRRPFRQTCGHFRMDGAHKGHVKGAAPEELWVRAEVSPREAAAVVAHEAKHASQYQRYIAGAKALDMADQGPRAVAQQEADAEAYERKALREWDRIESLSPTEVIDDLADELDCSREAACQALGCRWADVVAAEGRAR